MDWEMGRTGARGWGMNTHHICKTPNKQKQKGRREGATSVAATLCVWFPAGTNGESGVCA